MIFSSLNTLGYSCQYPGAVQKALDWIAGQDITHMDAGTYELCGWDLYINIQDIITQPAAACRPERHNDFLDIQYVAAGVERMGCTPYTGEETVLAALKDKDMILYQDLKEEAFVDVAPGGYCIFFPNDIHRPGCAAGVPGSVRKAVAKIRRNLL